MPREEYQQALDELRTEVRSMADLVLGRLRSALEALETRDEALAERVIYGDDEVNRLYLDLEQECIDLLALQQPVASDLRVVAASFKIITDLERIADLAANLAQYALAAEHEVIEEIDVSAIGDLAVAQVEAAMDAYETNDAARCHEIVRRDDEIDARCERASERLVRELIEREVADGDSWTVEQLMDDVSQLLLTIRDLERVGDHAVNIAARTLYMVENDDELIY